MLLDSVSIIAVNLHINIGHNNALFPASLHPQVMTPECEIQPTLGCEAVHSQANETNYGFSKKLCVYHV